MLRDEYLLNYKENIKTFAHMQKLYFSVSAFGRQLGVYTKVEGRECMPRVDSKVEGKADGLKIPLKVGKIFNQCR